MARKWRETIAIMRGMSWHTLNDEADEDGRVQTEDEVTVDNVMHDRWVRDVPMVHDSVKCVGCNSSPIVGKVGIQKRKKKLKNVKKILITLNHQLIYKVMGD